MSGSPQGQKPTLAETPPVPPAVARFDTTRLPFEAIVPGPFNPRRSTDPDALTELTESVRSVGVLEPLLVRPLPSDGPPGRALYELIAGSRRLAAAKAAGLVEVPVRVLALTDEQAAEVAIVENLQRQDVHPLDEAEGFHALLQRPGLDVAVIAMKVGKSEGYVYQRLSLRKLIGPAQDLLLKDKITTAHGLLLSRLPEPDQRTLLKDLERDVWEDGKYVKVPISVRQLAQLIEQNFHLDLHSATWPKDDTTLLPAAGACTTCPKRTGFMPSLFADIAKKDVCTDRSCFKAKTAAWVALQEARLREKAPNPEESVVKITEASYHPPAEEKRLKKDGVLLAQDFTPAGKKVCPATKEALVVDGKSAGKVQKVCTDRRCKVHQTSPESSNARHQDEYKKRQRQEAQAQKRESERRLRIYAAVVDRVDRLDLDDLGVVATVLLDCIGHDHQVRLCKFLELSPVEKKQTYGGHTSVSKDHEEPVRKAIQSADEKQMARLLIAMALISQSYKPNYSLEAPTLLNATAKRYGVDLSPKAEDTKGPGAKADRKGTKSATKTPKPAAKAAKRGKGKR